MAKRNDPRARRATSAVFLNVPYDRQFTNLYLAYIAGLSAFGLTPRATLEIPGGEARLDRILQLIASCVYSFHDLSRVQLDRNPPRTPRFNMPFELGLTVAWCKVKKISLQHLFVFEAVDRRLLKSLSDFQGADPYIHDGKVRGVFRELNSALVREPHKPTVSEMSKIYRGLKRASSQIIADTGAKSLFEARTFEELATLAKRLAEIQIPSLRRA